MYNLSTLTPFTGSTNNMSTSKNDFKMVAGAFPIVKLGALLLRQISSPIARTVKERAKKHPFFRNYICLPPAHFYNWFEVKMHMWAMGLGRPKEIPVLRESVAIELGANLLGECVVFLIACSAVFLEYSRQVRKDAVKEKARADEMNSLQEAIKDLYSATEQKSEEIRELKQEVLELVSRIDKNVDWKS